MNGDIMVDGEPFELEASGVTDAHLRGIPLIAPRKRAVRVSALGKVPRHRRSSRVVVSYTPKGVGWRTAKGWVR